jgi:uncharacterized protein YjbJ (UPF0337 family)
VFNPLDALVARRVHIGKRRFYEMNKDQIEGNWKQFSGKVKEKFGKLTDDDLTYINGKRDQLIGRIQERYGIKKEEAEKQIDEFYKTHPEWSATKTAPR